MSAPDVAATAQPAEPRRTVAPFGRRVVRVERSRDLGAYRLLACADPGGPVPRPGQFYMLATVNGWGGGEDERPLLPRAFSHMGHAAGELSFLLEDVGPGTRRLAALGPGEELWLLGPLGQGFGPAPPGRRALLVGGGIGVAPLLALRDELGVGARTLFGFRDAAHARGFVDEAGMRIATDDGSHGHAGLVTELLRAELDADPAAAVFACGPPPMLEAVRAECAQRAVPAQLALESGMACGFGACFGCVVPTRNGFIRVCVDGPVVDAADLESALVPGTGH